MRNPEIADVLVRARKRHVVLDVLVAEERRIEIEADAFFLREINPGLKMLRLDGIAVDVLVRDAIRRVEVELVLARNQRIRLADVGHELFRIACAARIIARRRDATRQRVAVKAEHVIALPAVHRDAHARELLERCFDIDASRCIGFFCFFKS